MIAKLLLSTLAAAALSGCMTNGYDYSGGRGDYYYGQPTIEYGHYGYGVPYGSYGYGFGYSSYGHGYPYGYYGYPYGYYPYGYYDYPDPPPPAQPPDPGQPADRSSYSVKEWAREHGYGQVHAPAGTGYRPESNADASAARQLTQARQPQPQPPVRMATPGPVRSAVPAAVPRPSSSPQRMSPPRSVPAPRTYPSRPAGKRVYGGTGDDDTNVLPRTRIP